MRKILAPLYSIYHMLWAIGATIWYGFPSRKIYVIGVTGTKGKSSTVEMINQVLEAAGFKTAVAGTIRFKINEESEPNMFKMSMPGRGYIQKFLNKAVKAGCDYAIVEMTSEGATQHRHFGIELDALVFTNLSPEHIESHGSYEKYRGAKLRLAKAFTRSHKPNKIFIGNGEDKETEHFLRTVGNSAEKVLFKLKDWDELPEPINLSLPGTFNKYNALAAMKLTEKIGVEFNIIKQALENFSEIKGRVQKIYASTPELKAKQEFTVVVDYAHTADSLEKFYQAWPENSRKVCILGGTGGGRDQAKREIMGQIADKYCDTVIVTNEDPYDEDPGQIIDMVAKGVTKHTLYCLADRREAIRYGLEIIHEHARYETADADKRNTYFLLITGKGTDPFIMGPHGTKTPWSDATVAQEEIDKLLQKS